MVCPAQCFSPSPALRSSEEDWAGADWVLPGSLCSHAPPLARRKEEKEEEEEGREGKEKERGEGKIFKCDILSFVI